MGARLNRSHLDNECCLLSCSQLQKGQRRGSVFTSEGEEVERKGNGSPRDTVDAMACSQLEQNILCASH